MVSALLYLPDDAAARLAASRVAGRTLAVRALVAALRAGATVSLAPAALRDREVEQAQRRMPALAAAVQWVAADTPAPAEPSGAWLLLPASSLIHVGALAGLLAAPAPRGAVLAPSAAGPAPVALVPIPLVAALWKDLAAGRPIGTTLGHHLAEAGAALRQATGPLVTVRTSADLASAEQALEATLGIAADSGVDRYLHRRGSRWISRLLVRTPVTPNQVSLLSLAIGLVAVWCFWRATAASAFAGVLLYALASIVDHADGEIARLTFQESRLGANLDWTIDTIIHAGTVLGIGISSGAWPMGLVGVLAAAGVTLSALFARYLPREIEVGPTVGGLLKNIANRDLFYLVLLSFAVLRALAPSLVFLVGLVVAVGSQVYWIGCLARISGTRAAADGGRSA
ncbi:MAG TPA: CDP-alcohol phosphatidyltransferase family protein [Methylomirabilota bacterium]|nr:CDP-alcohol phosphatidyltransferase family protein [Methylomirabilota bacterium]